MSSVISFLLASAPFIPAALSIASFLMRIFGASASNLAAYEKLIRDNKDTGLISVETHDVLVKFHQALVQREKAKKQVQAAHQAVKDEGDSK